MPDQEKITLEWGQTPWDNLSREDLLKEVWRMWLVIERLNGLALDHVFYEKYNRGISDDTPIEIVSPFYSKEGRGGAALEMARQVINPILEKYDQENVYRSFFRYSPDLLFKSEYRMIGAGWTICPVCGVMIGDREGEYVGKPCRETRFGKPVCDGVMRRLEWSDLKRPEMAAA